MVVYYDQSVYDQANMITKISTFTGYGAIAFFFIGMLTSKIVGVEMMAVLQVSFLSLITLSQMNPCFSALTHLWFVNGFNYFSLTKDYRYDSASPIQAKGI